MEDRYSALIKARDVFFKILDSAQRLSKTSSEEVRDNALMLIEFIKQYYMNYPLKGQTAAVTSSLFDELEFYSLEERTIKNFDRSHKPVRHRSSSHQRSEWKKKGPDAATSLTSQVITKVPSLEDFEAGKHSEESGSARLYEMLKKSSPMVTQYLGGQDKEDKLKHVEAANMTPGEIKEVEDYTLWKAKTVHLAYGSEAIISLIHSPYLTSRIIVRDLTGKHAWLITEHRVLDYNCIDTIDYNDKAAVYKNVLNLRGDKKLKDMIIENKDGLEQFKEEKKEAALKLEQELIKSAETEELEKLGFKKISETDSLAQIVSLLSKHCSDIRLVLFILRLTKFETNSSIIYSRTSRS